MSTGDEQTRDMNKHAEDLEKEVRRMQHRADELEDEIGTVRQEFKNRRDDENVPGLPPEPEAEREQTPSDAPEANFPATGNEDSSN